ncbi:hypothetical protein BO94DRAFT_571514 [Aspergillus sclerotioniger CBS 115572]|uniref:Zn(2)-C6 fungal-type domain-containing protein n=1 Tax=Aspergillus sclerotioniger CBS 115572 TaxID=1450535 RepID=A0A317XD37_9EURO|nr:hypothetical protein BO94DRAFT_571514 [Aspergillus sclerotioniger CBS 115572]PWY96051.1 hypothetical protein BO94DRAFT_571514 [Aspergillus sclerotioniger CBS 115572]
MTTQQPFSGSADSRKRVYKACDRCRVKKAKCNGFRPCVRCTSDNAICFYGAGHKAYKKSYPTGYAEALEQQHDWLVDGLQQLYRRMCDGEGWRGGPVSLDHHGHPCSHELLTRLGALDESKGEHFEEDTGAMQQRLWSANTAQATVRSDNGLNPLNHPFCLPSLAPRQPPLPLACVAPSSVWPPIQAFSFPVDGDEIPTPMPNPMLGMTEIRNSPNADMGHKYSWGVDPVRHTDVSPAFLFEPQ